MMVAITKQKRVVTWGVVNFLPNYQNGEDKAMRYAHRSCLNTQSHLTDCKQDKILTRKFMDLTFPHRRKLLIRDLAKINDVLERCPIR